MADTNIQMIRGDTLSFGIEYDGTDQDLDTAFFTCRRSDAERSIVFQKAINDGITKVGTGKYVVRVAPEDTVGTFEGTYLYDLQLGLNGDIFTPLIGALILIAGATT